MVRFFASFLILFSHWALAQQADSELLVIVNLQNEIIKLEKSELQKIFSGKKLRWNNGQRITVINSKMNTWSRIHFYKQILEVKEDHVFRYHNRRKVFRTLQVQSPEEIIKIVEKIPGAIGYIPSRYFMNRTKKVLTVK